MDVLADRRIALEVCPQSNVRTGALALQLRRPAALSKIIRSPPLSSRDPIVLSTEILRCSIPRWPKSTSTPTVSHDRERTLRMAQMSFDLRLTGNTRTTS